MHQHHKHPSWTWLIGLACAFIFCTCIEAKDRLGWGVNRAARIAVYPSTGMLYVSADFDRRNVRIRDAISYGKKTTSATVEVRRKGVAKVLAATQFNIHDGQGLEKALSVPELKTQAGEYIATFRFEHPENPRVVEVPFQRKRFEWENNSLGKGDDVPEPFIPVSIKGDNVGVIMRQMEMNGYGLFNQVIADGTALLDAPMCLMVQKTGGQIEQLPTGSLNLVQRSQSAVTYKTEARHPLVSYSIQTRIEFDGVARLEVQLKPGTRPDTIEKLWLEVPFKNHEVPLMHAVVDGPRVNYSGYIAKGEGSVWNSNHAKRYLEWQNSFVPYLWLGSEKPGLAIFAESDKGWITEKNRSKTPTHEMIRQGERLTLRLYVINHTTKLETETNFTLGIQASPVRPMPNNWRKLTKNIPGGSGPVTPWGGIHCASMTPHNNDWRVVDEVMLPAIKTGVVDFEKLEALNDELKPPLICGKRPWIDLQRFFAKRYAGWKDRMLMTYAMENKASMPSDEWKTFQDEWGCGDFSPRTEVKMSIFTHGVNANPSENTNNTSSFGDYVVWVQEQWLKRGIGIYWDNSRPMATFNTRSTSAYKTSSGIQPGMPYWGLRETHKRVYKLLVKHQKTYGDQVQWSCHTTNALLLPLHSWPSVVLVNEWHRPDAFSPDHIRAENMGWQVGSIAFTLNPLYGKANPIVYELSQERKSRIRWGMAMVHELTRSGYVGAYSTEESHRTCPPLERIILEFGYADEPELKISHYWEKQPALSVDNENVKWILMHNPKTERRLLVLCSWADTATQVGVDLSSIAPNLKLQNAESKKILSAPKGENIGVEFPAPYGVQIFEIL